MEKLDATMESQTGTGHRTGLTRRFLIAAGAGTSAGGGGFNGCDHLPAIKYF